MDPSDLARPWPIFLATLPSVLFVALVAAFLVGIPAHFLLQWAEFRSVAAYAVFGALLGGATGIALFSFSALTIAALLCGIAVSVAFRYAARDDEHFDITA